MTDRFLISSISNSAKQFTIQCFRLIYYKQITISSLSQWISIRIIGMIIHTAVIFFNNHIESYFLEYHFFTLETSGLQALKIVKKIIQK